MLLAGKCAGLVLPALPPPSADALEICLLRVSTLPAYSRQILDALPLLAAGPAAVLVATAAQAVVSVVSCPHALLLLLPPPLPLQA